MKSLALSVALLWWTQTPLCLFADASHSHGAAPAVSAREHHHPGHRAGSPAGPADGSVPHDPACAEHCASLAQAVPVPDASSTAPPAGVLVLPISPLAMAPASTAPWPSLGVLRKPPPDPLRHGSVLRL